MLLIFWSLDSKQKDKINESVDEKIKSMVIKRFEIEIREKEETISKKIFRALYERRTGEKVLHLYCSYSVAN